MKRFIILLITITFFSQLFSQTKSNDDSNVTKTLVQKKQYAGLGFGGVVGNIGNKYIGFLKGYGGSFAAILGNSAVLEGSLMYYKGSATNVEGIPDGSIIDVLAIAFYWNYNLLSPKTPIQPFLQVGVSPTWIGTEYKGSQGDYEGIGLLLGAGVDIRIGKYASIYAAGCYRLSWVSYTNVSTDFADIHKKLVNLWGLQGGLRLIIPIREL